MKGYIYVFGENVEEYYYLVVETKELFPTRTPIVNPKFAVYSSPTEVTIKKIISFKDKSKRDCVVGRIEYFNDFTILRVGDMKHLSCRIYKSFKAVKYRYYTYSYPFLHGNYFLQKNFRNDGFIRYLIVYRNGNYITRTQYFEDIIININIKNNKTVVINRETKEVHIHQGVLSFHQSRNLPLENLPLESLKCSLDLQKINSREFFHLGLPVSIKIFDVNGCLTRKYYYKNAKGLNVTKTHKYQRNKIQIF
jgi:hypothetical protein